MIIGMSSSRLGQDLLGFEITKCDPNNNQAIMCETDA